MKNSYYIPYWYEIIITVTAVDYNRPGVRVSRNIAKNDSTKHKDKIYHINDVKIDINISLTNMGFKNIIFQNLNQISDIKTRISANSHQVFVED